MQVTIQYKLSEEGRKVEAATGRPAQEARELVAEVGPDSPVWPLVAVAPDGRAHVRWPSASLIDSKGHWSYPRYVEREGVREEYRMQLPTEKRDTVLTITALEAELRAYAEASEQAKRDAEERIQSRLAKKQRQVALYPIERARVEALDEKALQQYRVPDELNGYVAPDSAYGLGTIVEHRLTHLRNLRAQAESAPAREAAARRNAQITAWVAEHGTQNQQERFAAGLLAEQEVLDAIETEAFGPTGEWPQYEKLACPDVPHREYCSGERGCKFTSEAAVSVSADEWGQLKALKELLPTATIEVREHEAVCKECEETATRRGIRVTLQVGELVFTREYGVTA